MIISDLLINASEYDLEALLLIGWLSIVSISVLNYVAGNLWGSGK